LQGFNDQSGNFVSADYICAMPLRKILLVDDDAAFHFLQKLVLNENNINCQIDSVYDGYEALRYMEDCNGSPDLILLDLNMPRWNGLDFLESCLKCGHLPDYVKIFILTSSLLPEDKERAMAYNFVTGYLEKPLNKESIKEILSHF
jgi:CheY-like chemotaxis protein